MIRNRTDNIVDNEKEGPSTRYQPFEIEENDHDRNMQQEGTKTLSTVSFLTYKTMLITLVILVAISQVILFLHIYMNKAMSTRTYENPIHYYSDETEHQNGRNHDGNQYYRTNYNNYNEKYYNAGNGSESGAYSKNSGYFSWGKSQQHSSNGNGGSQYSNGNYRNRGGYNQNRNSNNGNKNRNRNWNRNGNNGSGSSGSTYGTQKKVNPIPH